MIARRKSRPVRVGDVEVGGGAPVSVQSMTTTKTADVDGTLAQVYALKGAGADIVRITCNDVEAAQGLAEIVPRSPVPIIADIHFQYRLALAALEAGVQGLRLNPGNIRNEEHIKTVARAAGEAGVPIRVGVNAGSLDKELLETFGAPVPEALVESALREVRLPRGRRVLRHQDLGQALARSVDGRVLPTARRDGRIPAPPRRHRGGPATGRADQVGGRDRDAASRGDRRHHPLLAHRRPGRGGQGWARAARVPRAAGEARVST